MDPATQSCTLADEHFMPVAAPSILKEEKEIFCLILRKQDGMSK